MTHVLIDRWRQQFGHALPVGFVCRQALADRWLRIHSLPGSKRYAETEDEYDDLLQRQNSVASHVLGEGSDCVVYMTGDTPEWRDDGSVSLGERMPMHVLTVYDADERFFASPVQIFALPVVWRANAFNELIRAVADDQAGPVLFANTKKGSIYAPYDGGADLFFPTPEEVGWGRLRFQAWLSSRADGL